MNKKIKTKSKQNLNQKKCTSIGVESEGALIDNSLYRTTFKKSVEYEKGPKLQMLKIECFYKISFFKNGQKIQIWHFLGLGERPKAIVESEGKTNLKKKINYHWDVCNQYCINFFFFI